MSHCYLGRRVKKSPGRGNSMFKVSTGKDMTLLKNFDLKDNSGRQGPEGCWKERASQKKGDLSISIGPGSQENHAGEPCFRHRFQESNESDCVRACHLLGRNALPFLLLSVWPLISCTLPHDHKMAAAVAKLWKEPRRPSTDE